MGDKVYLSTQNLNLPKGRARKLMLKFIGPYKVTKSHLEILRYTLDLPPERKARRIVPSFPVSLLHQITKLMMPYFLSMKYALSMTLAMPRTMNGWWMILSPTNGKKMIFPSSYNGT